MQIMEGSSPACLAPEPDVNQPCFREDVEMKPHPQDLVDIKLCLVLLITNAPAVQCKEN